MILILNNALRCILTAVVLVSLLGGAWSFEAKAQSALTLSVSPTLFEMSAVPGQVWKSSIKVINNNNYPLTVYGNPVNFAPQGEGGQGNFKPLLDNGDQETTLAGWIEMTSETIEVPAEQSELIEFVVTIPEDAPPGGHFAAILVGTQPPVNEEGAMELRTSQIVSSLFFLRIEGDVIEDGAIRSFSSANNFTEVTSADFELRFENKGNVHLQPQGSIEIYNMWGSERGLIPINQRTDFGNVLPQSIRKFNFTWTGEQSFSDIGRFRAVASLAYGSDGRKFTSDTTYFWIVPIKPMALTLLFILGVILFVRWSIKTYVRRMLEMAGAHEAYVPRRERISVEENDLDLSSTSSVRAPVVSAVTDLKQRLGTTSGLLAKIRSVGLYVVQYRLFFTAFVITCLIVLIVVKFFIDSGSDRDYEVEIVAEGATVTLNSEEVRLAELLRGAAFTETAEQPYTIDIYNASAVSGAAAELAVTLRDEGYAINEVDFVVDEQYDRSVIVFTPDLESEALTLSALLDNLLVSADSASETLATIKIFIGNDYRGE